MRGGVHGQWSMVHGIYQKKVLFRLWQNGGYLMDFYNKMT